MFPEITFNYTYIGEITKDPMKNRVLYECDMHACNGVCNLECCHTTNITHAKNFKYDNGTWVERIREENKND